MIFILNKKDLGLDETAAGLGFVIGQEPVAISAHTGEGLDALEAAIETRLLGPAAAAALAGGAPFTSRQVQRLEDFRAGLLDDQHGMDVIVHLRKLIGTRPDPEELKHALRT
jgi:50S ribosomal subunit-associated GTPase HflX